MKLPYDPVKDLAPISLIGTIPFVVVVHPDAGIESVSDLIAKAKVTPGAIAFGSIGEVALDRNARCPPPGAYLHARRRAGPRLRTPGRPPRWTGFCASSPSPPALSAVRRAERATIARQRTLGRGKLMSDEREAEFATDCKIADAQAIVAEQLGWLLACVAGVLTCVVLREFLPVVASAIVGLIVGIATYRVAVHPYHKRSAAGHARYDGLLRAREGHQ